MNSGTIFEANNVTDMPTSNAQVHDQLLYLKLVLMLHRLRLTTIKSFMHAQLSSTSHKNITEWCTLQKNTAKKR